MAAEGSASTMPCDPSHPLHTNTRLRTHITAMPTAIPQPCVIRVAPAPLYNTAEDVLYFVQALERAQQKCIREGLVYAAAAKE